MERYGRHFSFSPESEEKRAFENGDHHAVVTPMLGMASIFFSRLEEPTHYTRASHPRFLTFDNYSKVSLTLDPCLDARSQNRSCRPRLAGFGSRL